MWCFPLRKEYVMKKASNDRLFYKHNNQLVTLLCRVDVEATNCVDNNVVFETLNIVYCGSVLIEKAASLNDMCFYTSKMLVIRMDDNVLSIEDSLLLMESFTYRK